MQQVCKELFLFNFNGLKQIITAEVKILIMLISRDVSVCIYDLFYDFMILWFMTLFFFISQIW